MLTCFFDKLCLVGPLFPKLISIFIDLLRKPTAFPSKEARLATLLLTKCLSSILLFLILPSLAIASLDYLSSLARSPQPLAPLPFRNTLQNFFGRHATKFRRLLRFLRRVQRRIRCGRSFCVESASSEIINLDLLSLWNLFLVLILLRLVVGNLMF